MNEKKMVVDIKARIDWMTAPESVGDGIRRQLINEEIQKTADQLRTAVELIICEMMLVKVK